MVNIHVKLSYLSYIIQVMQALVLSLLGEKHDVCTYKVRVSLNLTCLY